ncbi:hypothetical protein C8F01DRAFT_1242200 [Mycena amicta]|nr:hypothetical protein C8F01DRAFT_1242200 [Mycena amicta]
MSEFAIVNLDKRECVDAGGYGSKVAEAFMNGMPPDFIAANNRVPIGHWAGDRVLIVDEYSGEPKEVFPEDFLAQYPAASLDYDALGFAEEKLRLTRVDLPHPGNAYGAKEEANADLTRFKTERDRCFPADRVWVVRNLSKKWYARADVLFKAKHLHGPTVEEGVGFGHLLWAELGGAELAAFVHREGGVGDRFDICTLDAVEGAAEWQDLSKCAKACMAHFKESYDGDLGDYDSDGY